MKSNLEEKKERPACHSAIISRKKNQINIMQNTYRNIRLNDRHFQSVYVMYHHPLLRFDLMMDLFD